MPKIIYTNVPPVKRLRALHFDNGQFEHYDLGDIAAPGKFHTSDDWTVCGLFNLGSSTADQRAVVSKWGSGGATRQFLMASDISSPAGLDVSFANGTLFTGAHILNRGQWYCGIVSNIGATGFLRKRVYDLTGRLLEEQTATNTTDLTGSETEPVRIGIKQTNSDEFDGEIAFCAYFSINLPLTEWHRLSTSPFEMVRRHWTNCIWAYEMVPTNPINLGSGDISVTVTNSPTAALGPAIRETFITPIFIPDGAEPPAPTLRALTLLGAGI